MSRCLRVRRTLRVRCCLRVRRALRMGCCLRVRRVLSVRRCLRVRRARRVGCSLPVRLALRVDCTVRVRLALRMLCMVSSGLLCDSRPSRLLRRRMPLLAPRFLRDWCRWTGLRGWRVSGLVSSTRSDCYKFVFDKRRRLRRQPLGNRMGIGELLLHLSPLRLWYILPTAFDLAGSQLPPRLRPD